MNRGLDSLQIRPFEPDDAEFCFRIRAEAFVQIFHDEIGTEAVSAGVNAYVPADFIRMARSMSWFVAEAAGQPVGFCALRMLDDVTAELLFLYVQLPRIGQGIGTYLLRFVEEWLAEQCREISSLTLDTIVPRYNQRFYERMGFSVMGEGVCKYPGGTVRSVRLKKRLKH